MYFSEYSYEIAIDLNPRIEGSNYRITPEILRINESGALQPITITSDYPLNNYDTIVGTYGELVSLNRKSDNEITAIYQVYESDGVDRYDQPLLKSSASSAFKPIPLTKLYQGRYLDAVLALGDRTSLEPTAGIFYLEINSNVD